MPFFVEVTMTAPDIIRLEIRDPIIQRGLFQQLGTPDAAAAGSWTTRTHPITGASTACFIGGFNQNFARFTDVLFPNYYNRAAGDVAADWSITGGLTVTNVYRFSWPYCEGIVNTGGQTTANQTTFRHYIWLKVSSALVSGTNYVITPPAGVSLVPISFPFNDKVTRASSIVANQVGISQTDDLKLAYLTEFIPGLGPVNFASTYGISSFNILDSAGNVAYNTGTFAQRVTPSTTETSGGAIRYYIDTTVAPKKFDQITNASPGVIRSIAHGYSGGEIIFIVGAGISGGGIVSNPSLCDTPLTVVLVDADHFSLTGTIATNSPVGSAINTPSMTTYVPGTFIATGNSFNSGYDSLIYSAYPSNRAGTYVYGLDASTATGLADGSYCYQIPGLGISDYFPVNANAWLSAATTWAQGYYHQTSGIAIDGRFGYARGPAQVDGFDGTQLFLSLLPMGFTSEDGGYNGGNALDQGLSGLAPFLTATRGPAGLFGTFHDAGDWCSVLYYHADAPWGLLDSGYEYIPTAGHATNFNFPKMSQTWGQTYAGTDSLSDVIHMAVYFAEFYRLAQNAFGAVPSGTSFGQSGFGDGGATETAPSPANYKVWVLNAPDHPSTYLFAVVAAKLAVVFWNLGFTTLGNLWATSAESAWTWAEGVYTGLQSDTNFYYNTTTYNGVALGLQANASWSGAQYLTALGTFSAGTPLSSTGMMKFGAQQRFNAAGALFRMAGVVGRSQVAYDAVVHAFGVTGLQNSSCTLGTWEYSHGAGFDAALYASANGNNIFINPMNTASTASEATNAYRTYNGGIGTGVNIDQAIHGYVLSSASPTNQARLRRQLQGQLSVTLGANPTGLCYSSNSGKRSTLGILHRDWQGMGSGCPQPTGYTGYTWAGTTYAFGVFNFSSDSPQNFTVENPTGLFSSTFGVNRIVYPHKCAVPMWRAVPEVSYCVQFMEGTTWQTIVPNLLAAMWLNYWNK